ncbi:DUF3310 domain-containing protein [Mesorhizobium sp.]|uniref:DUF3310 domain-containing protein n=1 Tax=Mesorhizobium sp. TaxID=1871066 RepID=UPI0025EE8737|nr:DUF3310 domain-containing protein [Mesorhizobium sp.]
MTKENGRHYTSDAEDAAYGSGVSGDGAYSEDDWSKVGIPVHADDGDGRILNAKYPLRSMQQAVRQGLEAGTIQPQTSALDAIASVNLATAVSRGVASPSDMVNLPPHYARFKIEPIRFIAENKLDWFQGNIIKYVMRHDAKNGSEDIRKTIRYANMYLLFLQGDPDWWMAGKPEDFQHGEH